MSRNIDSRFSVTPLVEKGRSRFERPFNHKFTFNTGDLVPFYWTEILPGDTVSMNTSKVVRMSTLLDPVMDNLYLDCYYFFVPMRLVWNHTREFFGENTAGAWYPQTTYTIPQTVTASGNNNANVVAVQTIADYMGIPVGVSGLSFSSLPLRAYDLVYDEWFRDQNTQSPVNIYKGDSNTNYVNTSNGDGGLPFKACKLHDYFTSGLPSPQRGPAVQLPLTGTIPVNLGGSVASVTTAAAAHYMGNPIKFTSGTYNNLQCARVEDSDHMRDLMLGGNNSNYENITYSNFVVNWPNNVTANLAGASPITVNDLRMAFQMQKWYETSALFGGRYVEYLHAHFGVTSPDARLQRSEYLGGNRVPIMVHQVEQTTPTTGKALGSLAAYSATSDDNDDFTHSFVEHGFLIGVCTCRHKRTYSQGLEKAWSRKTLFEYYDPLFANLGNMPILEKEIYAQGTTADDNVFAYQEAWADYRYQPDRVSGYFRPGITGSLASWHYGDYYTSAPTLSASWIKQDAAMVDRTLAVQSSSAPQLIADFLCNATFVRAMPLYSVPGLIDHH